MSRFKAILFNDSDILKIALKELVVDGWPTFIQCARIGKREITIARGDPVIPSSERCVRTFLYIFNKGLHGMRLRKLQDMNISVQLKFPISIMQAAATSQKDIIR